MKYKLAWMAILLFLVSCASQPNPPQEPQTQEPPFIKPVAPLQTVPGFGVTFIIPDEDGWMFFDPDGEGSVIGKTGKTEIESYIISLDYYQKTVPESFAEFYRIYETLEKVEIAPPRHQPLIVETNARNNENYHLIDFYYLVEDYQPEIMPSGQNFMYLEAMGFFMEHPNIPDIMIRVAYSHRYKAGNEDPSFKQKAQWVLDRVELTGQ